MDLRKIVTENRILAIMRNVPLEKTIPYVQAIADGGVRFFEVAMNTPYAAEQIRLMRDHFREDVYIGAGTVINLQRADKALEAGAQFLLSPSADTDVLSFCEKHEIALMPGVMTPTDVSLCYNHGFSTLKLFPANDLPKNYVKSLKGPFEETEYVAFGGVTAQNIGEYFARGFIGVGIGAAMLPKEMMEKEDWETGTEYVRDLLKRTEA